MTPSRILISTNHPFLRFPSTEVYRTVQLIYRNEKKRLSSLAIVFTHNKYIKNINKKFLSHGYVTDVIAFPLGRDGGVEAEIYINLDAARTQAHEYRITYSKETTRLLIHGILHILGYDDRNKRLKEKMLKREEHYLEFLRQ